MAETSDLGFDDPSFTEQEPQGNGAPGQGANGALDEDVFASGSPQAGGGAAFDPADFSEPAGQPAENGTAGYANPSGVSAQFAPPSEEPEAVTAMKEHLKTRMKDGEEAEQAGKAKADEEAAEFLKEFYEKRKATKAARIEEHREAHKLLGSQKPEGASEWERAISLIDFNFTRPSGSDLSRFRNVLFNAKGRGATAV